MFRNWLWRASNLLQPSSLMGDPCIKHIHCVLDIDQHGQLVLGDAIRAEQHRIQMVHIKNRQLQMTIEIWNQCSVSSLYAMQELVSDRSTANRDAKG
jgi:hypothetical protein